MSRSKSDQRQQAMRGEPTNQLDEVRLVSLKTIASLVDAHRTTVRRWLREAGIRPVAVGRGRNGAIRYRWSQVESWLTTGTEVD